jgi:DUF4097 and DUF4098 domain-containing protein YvlB
MPDPAPLHITTRSGNIRVVADGHRELAVEGGIVERQDDGTLRIRRAPSADVIEVTCAVATDVTVGTDSGKVELRGALGAVRVATLSGKIRIEEAARIDVRTKSGTIDIGTCAGECRVMTKSSKVHVARAGRATVAAISGTVLLDRVGGAEVKSISGKVFLALAPDSGRVSVHTDSGKVEIRIPPTARPVMRLRSLSGRIDCDCPPGDDFEIAVASISGAIRVSSA